MTPQEFANRLNVSRETLEALSCYAALIKKWQPHINLISSATITNIWARHIFDSAQLISYMPSPSVGQNLKIIDIGSGAGFPGLVLSILGAGTVHLVEANERKAVFLQTVIRELGLPAFVVNKRIESMPAFMPDVITARAVASLPKLIKLIDGQIHSGLTCLFLKGAKVEEELTNFQTYSNMRVHLYQSQSHFDGMILKLTMPKLIKNE